MNLKGKRAGLVISWHRSLSVLSPWRKGKVDRDAVLDGEVVLTKVKLFRNFHQRLLTADDSASTISTGSEQDISDPPKTSEVNHLHIDSDSAHPQMTSSSNYLSDIFSDSQLPKLYKFESEDSGVELPSGANSPSTPTGSEQSFVVHSRESSCDSSNVNTDADTLPDKLAVYMQSSETEQVKDIETEQVEDSDQSTVVDTQDNVFLHSEELSPSPLAGIDLQICENVFEEQFLALDRRPEEEVDMSETLGNESTVTNPTCLEDIRHGKQSGTGARYDCEPACRSATSLNEYMDECCRLSEKQQTGSSPLGSGLGYLKHICQLMEKISQLQETNLMLQREISSLQRDARVTKTKQHCNCGAADLDFQDTQKRNSRSEFLSLSGTLSDLSTIPEVTRNPVTSFRRALSSDGSTSVPLWRRNLSRRSYAEGEVRFLRDSVEELSVPQGRLSENYTWGRVKDLVKKTKMRNQSRLRLTSSSLRMSCPQLDRPALGSGEIATINRNSMIALGHQSKLDFPWQQ